MFCAILQIGIVSTGVGLTEGSNEAMPCASLNSPGNSDCHQYNVITNYPRDLHQSQAIHKMDQETCC